MLAYKSGRSHTGWMWIAIFIVHSAITDTRAAAKHSPKRSGFIGCLFSGSLCSASEECFDDHLFGTCQRRDALPDDYHYTLSSDQIRHLSSSLQRLVSNGYTWRDPFTQCMLAQMLFTYRHGSARNHEKPVCVTTAVDDAGKIDDTPDGLDSPADPGFSGGHHSTGVNNDVMGSDINVSRLAGDMAVIQRIQFDRKSYKEFMQFMSSLSADDLYALKQFLLEESMGIGNTAARKFSGPVLPTRDKNIAAVNDDKTSTKVVQSEYTADDVSTRLKMTSTVDQATPSIVVSTDDRGDSDDGVNVSLQSKVGTQRRVQILIYVLFGLVAIFVVVCLITCFQFCRSFQITRRWWKGSVDDELATEEYQDLCRQHMTATMTEKPRGWHDPVVGSRDQSTPVTGSLPLKEEPVKSGVDISTGTLVLSYMEKYLNDNNRIQREWDELSAVAAEVDLGSFAPTAFDASNARKNRCADILPYEKSRVLLRAEDNVTGSTYINASYIKDDDPRRALYIVTQGPLPNTVTDFWQMVWEQGSVVIVNLTCLVEGSVTLCHRYWPETGRDLFHIYEVSLLSEHDCCDNYIVRNFALRNTRTSEVRDITQFHFLSWPSDLPSVPESAPALLEFRRRVNKSFRGRSPVVVHCSDGVGRTGTYCLIDVVLSRIAKGVKQIDIAATLEHLRDQRFDLIHTKEQYEFVLTAVAYEIHQMLFPQAR